MLTKEYWESRDLGELPSGCATWLIKVARDECCDWNAGLCVRMGQDCLLKDGHRCKWLEDIVLAPKDLAKAKEKLEKALRKKD